MTVETKISEFLYRSQDWMATHFDKVAFDLERGANTAGSEEDLASDIILFTEHIKSKFRTYTDEEVEYHIDKYYDLTGIRDVPVGSDSETIQYNILPSGSPAVSQDIVTAIRVGNAALQLVDGVWHISDATGEDYLLKGKGQILNDGTASTSTGWYSQRIANEIASAIAGLPSGLTLPTGIVDALNASLDPATENPFLTKNDIQGSINLKFYQPDTGGIEDNTPQWDQAQQDAFDQGKALFVPKDTYRIKSKSYPNQPGNIKMYIFYVPIIFEPGCELIYEGSDGDERGVNIQPWNTPLRAERLNLTPTTGATRLEVQAQEAGLNYVKTLPGNESQVDSFNVGECVHVACGANHLDFDDPLWLNDIMAVIVDKDNVTGTIYFDRSIPFPLSNYGFDGTAPGAYAQSVTVTKGQRFFFNNETYAAMAAGDTDAADPNDDGYISSITINDGGLDYVDGEVIIRALQPVNGHWLDLGETFDVTVDGSGTITAVTPQLGKGGYTSDVVIEVVSQNNNATAAADLSATVVGVPFKKVANQNGAIEDDRNASPIIQKVIDPIVGIDIIGSGSTIHFEDEVQSMLVIRNALDCSFQNFKLTGHSEFAMSTGNGATNPTFKYIDGLEVEEQTTGDASKSRIFSGFATHGLRLIECKGICGANGTDAQAIRLESFTDAEIIGGEYYNRYPFSMNSYEVFFDPGKLKCMKGVTFSGFRFPYRINTSAEAGFLDRLRDPERPPISAFGHIAGNTHVCSAEGFRAAGVHPTKAFSADDTYILRETHNGNNIVHPESVEFSPWKMATMHFEYEAGVDVAHNTWVDIGPQVMVDHDAINISDYQFILLSKKVLALNQPANGLLEIRLRGYNGSTPPRFLFSNDSEENDIELLGGKNLVELTDGAGGTARFFDTRTEQIQHKVNIYGVPGGYVRMMLNVLIKER